MVENKQFPMIILTGLSGAGKSTALKVFEDLGFFCVDGLPSGMVARLVTLFKEENPRNYRGLSLGMDIRQQDFLQEWQQTLAWLNEQRIRPQVVFLEASIDTLIQRYATTRRPHPLESKDLGLEQALETENELLAPLRQDADLVMDTTGFSVHDLRRAIQEKWDFLTDVSHGLRIHIISFGYKYGVPKEADLVFDLRFLPNPYFEEEIKHLSGQEPTIHQYVFQGEVGRQFRERFLAFLTYLLPLYAQEGRFRLTLALGCTGGYHRSVATAEEIFSALKSSNYHVSLEHRHLELG